MYNVLKPILNRGGAGYSMTRAESAAALNPLVDQHGQLILAYSAALRHLADRDLAATLNEGMNRLRTELFKLKETVLSFAGVPPNGVRLNADVHLGDTDAEIVHRLDDLERAYRDALREALDLPHHQLRTTAVLENHLKSSEVRVGVLHPFVTRMRRPSSDRPSQSRPAVDVPVDRETSVPADLDPDTLSADMHEQPVIEVEDVEDKA
ncbi:MAG: hypothetical protein AAGI91_07770 [Bacteroidota bacterium]